MPTAVERHSATITGRPDGQPMVFSHGYGCDQNMWRYVAPRFEDDFRVVLFDHIGAGRSDLRAYDPERYSSHRRLRPWLTRVLPGGPNRTPPSTPSPQPWWRTRACSPSRAA